MAGDAPIEKQAVVISIQITSVTDAAVATSSGRDQLKEGRILYGWDSVIRWTSGGYIRIQANEWCVCVC